MVAKELKTCVSSELAGVSYLRILVLDTFSQIFVRMTNCSMRIKLSRNPINCGAHLHPHYFRARVMVYQ